MIRARDANLVIWRRPQNHRIARIAEYLVNAWRHDIDVVAPVARAVEELTRSLIGRADGLMPGALISDIRDLASFYAKTTRTAIIHLKLERIDRQKCPLFHTDFVGLRLLTSYCGRGTEWLPEDGVNRDALGAGSNARIVTDRRRLRRLNPFWVGLLKGDAYAGNANRGCVHRSPPIERRSERRLVLTIDDLET